MKRILFLVVILSNYIAQGQITFSRYFTENVIPSIDNKSYVTLDFAWNMPGKVQSFMNNGITELEEGVAERAIYDFDEVIKLSPAFLPAFYYRGVAYKKNLKFELGEKDLLKAINLNPKCGEAYLMLGEIYQLQHKIDRAELQYDKAVELLPNLARGYYNLGLVEIAKSNPRKASKYFEKCHEVDAQFTNAYLMQGLLKYKEVSKKNHEAISFFDQTLQFDSTHSEALFWRGLSYLQLEENNKTVLDWNKLVRYNPDNPFFLLMRGFLNIELDDFDQAFNDLRKAILSNPENEENFRRGQTLLDKKIDLQYATAYTMRFSYGLDEEALGYLKKGFCYFISDKKLKAIENFKASEQIQSSATVLFLEALTFEHLEKHDSAFYYYEKALALDNEIIDAHKKRAIYRYGTKDWKGAYADLNEMSRLQPSLMVTYRLRGLIKSIQKDYYGALIDFSKYLNSDSTDHEILMQRAICRSYIKDEKGANEDFRKALNYDRFNWQIYERVIESYVSILNDTTNALATLKEYETAIPESISPSLRQAELFLQQKKLDSALIKIDNTLRRFHPVFYKKLNYSKALAIKGIVQFNRKDLASGITSLNKALKENPDNLEALYYRGKSYIHMGENRQAINDFKKLQKIGYSDSGEILQTLINK